MSDKASWPFLSLIVSATLGATAAACGPSVMAVDPRDSYDYAQSRWKDGATTGSKAGGSVVVIIDDAAALGAAVVYAKEATSTTLGGLAADGKEKKQVQAMVKKAGNNKSVGVMLDGYADTLAYLLEHHLSQHFDSVVVKKSSESEGLTGIHVSSEVSYSVVPRHSTFLVDVKLSGGGATGAGNGDRQFNKAHFGWFVPLFLMTFPVFMGIPAGILDSALKGTLRVSVLDAMDEAAAQFATSLAAGGG